MNSFRELLVWQKGMALVTQVYFLTKIFPKEELYALTAQIRRSAVSIPSNIAEGFGRHHKQDYIRFLEIARSSLYELQTQLEISKNVNYLTEEELNIVFEMCKELEKMINSFIKTIAQSK
jgi:four helix bundle protein